MSKGKKYRKFIRIRGKLVNKTFTRKTDADRWYQNQKHEKELLESGLSRPINSMILKDFAQKWLDYRKTQGKPTNSWIVDEQRLRIHILPKFGDIPMQQIFHSIWEQHLDSLVTKQNLSNATRNRVRTLLHKIYNDAKKDRVVLENPINLIPRWKESNDTYQYFETREKCEAYLHFASLEPDPFPVFAYLALSTGARVGEILALSWNEIDLPHRRLHIYKTVDWKDRKIHRRTKGGKGRWLGINDSSFKIILDYHQRTPNNGPNDLLVCTATGKLYNLPQIRRSHHKACKNAGLNLIRVHDLRHTYASHFVMNGGNLSDLQAILGHSNIQTTMRYAHLSPDHLLSKANVVNYSGSKNHKNIIQLHHIS